jgi:hypothetical protein
MELTSKTCVLRTFAFNVLVFTRNVLKERERISGKSKKPSPVSNVMVLTVKLDIVALDAKRVLIVALLVLKLRLMDVEKVEKRAPVAVVEG